MFSHKYSYLNFNPTQARIAETSIKIVMEWINLDLPTAYATYAYAIANNASNRPEQYN